MYKHWRILCIAACACAAAIWCCQAFAEPHKSSSDTSQASADAKRVAEGKRLFTVLNCQGCHSIENAGGCLAPPLDCVTQKDSEQFLMLRLGKGEEANFIKRIGHPELMPHPRFDKAQLKEIIAYLRTLPCKVNPEKPVR